MKKRISQVLLLAGALVILAGTIAGIAISVTSRRHRRDVRFGLERLDLLIADGEYAEAEAMTLWLAERAITATDGLRIARRAFEIYTGTGETKVLVDANRILVSEFPGNATFHELWIYSLVRAGRAPEALDFARRNLSDQDDGSLYAWTLLSAVTDGTAPDPAAVRESEVAPLVRLSPESRADDFLYAWELTGDWRYATDAALIHLGSGEVAAAAGIVNDASLDVLDPAFASRALYDASRYDDALAAIERLSREERATGALLEADLRLLTGQRSVAADIYTDALASEELPAEVVFANLAWLASDNTEAIDLLEEGIARSPDSWQLRRQLALRIATVDPERAFEAIDQMVAESPERFDEPARLLRLRLDPNPDQRGYDATIWRLVEEAKQEDSYRFAAWHFLARGDETDLARVLRSAERTIDEPSAWWYGYSGVLAARTDDWHAAVDHFGEAFRRDPKWYWALDRAIALLRTGHPRDARRAIQDALTLATNSPDPRGANAFLVASMLADDRIEARRLLDQAREIDPDNQQAMLLSAQLDSADR
jgi:predicted Zn-dependent protease